MKIESILSGQIHALLFVDDAPCTAEVITLAKDSEIKDPPILKQILQAR